MVFLSLLRGILLTLCVVLTPMIISAFLRYLLLRHGFKMPFPLDMLFVSILTFIILYIITFIFKAWYYLDKCKGKGRKWKQVFSASFWSPLLAIALSFVINFFPFFKVPFMITGMLGDIIHPFFSQLPEGLTYLPGHFLGIIITTLFVKIKC